MLCFFHVATAVSVAVSDCSSATSFVANMTVYGSPPARSFLTASLDTCCSACTGDCMAWYWRPHGSQGEHECLLFNASQAVDIRTGTCSTWRPPKSCAAALLRPLPTPAPPTPPPPPPTPAPGQSVSVTIAAADSFTISPYLSTFSLVYAWAPDDVYSNGTLAAWARAHRVATARWPAGMASYFNWENSTGQMGNSTLDPSWAGPPNPSELWMDMDEYLDLCNASGITRALVGVNYVCHNHDWPACATNESIARAVRQAQHVVQRGFPGAFYYVGNEDNAPGHADLIAAHARAIRGVDPTAKIFYNDNNVQPDSLIKFLQETGDAFDGVEFHGKWPYGGTPPKLPSFSYAQWLEEVPLVEHKSKQTWRTKIAGLRAAATHAGRPNFMLANNEYGLGKPSALTNFTRFSKSMVVAEFAMEMYIGGYDIASFWDNGDGCSPFGSSCDHSDHMLMDSTAAYRMNPMHFGLELLARATNSTMRTVTTSTSRVHGFAAKDGDQNTIRLYLMNKLEQDQPVHIALPTTEAHVDSTTIESMVDTDDHWGKIDASGSVVCGSNGALCHAVLPPVSISVITFA